MKTGIRGMSLGNWRGVWAAGLAAFVCCLSANPALAAGESPAARSTVNSASGNATTSVKPRKVRAVPARPSLAQKQGLRGTDDPLDLRALGSLRRQQRAALAQSRARHSNLNRFQGNPR
jgi:hypothetical protein